MRSMPLRSTFSPLEGRAGGSFYAFLRGHFLDDKVLPYVRRPVCGNGSLRDIEGASGLIYLRENTTVYALRGDGIVIDRF